MVSKTTAPTSSLDTVKLTLALVVLAAGMFGFYWFEQVALTWRVIAMFAVVGVAVGLVLWTELGQRLMSFSRESRVELRKVVWPTRQETIQITLIVLVLVFLIGLFLWLVDSLLFWGVQMITGQGA
ncbi:MAG: preprotein translocase subunit SecE [Halothiobacillaceae bacterium]|nr:preprotein translocase subunit SecE [Halothiobacillaceae bacterium]OYY73042.1 MAG: preprotein translocase subunit SecE [Gammaproteobacteria bacterium 28-57-27]